MNIKRFIACTIAALLTSMIMANVCAYEVSHSLPKQGVDYWWICNVTDGEYVYIEIEADTYSHWESRLYYSNLTVKEAIYAYDTHIHEFYADKTDNYLLRIYSRYQSLEYTFKWCSHSRKKLSMYEVSGSLPKQGVDYWWISNVTKGDLVLLAIEAETYSHWESRLYYSNLTLKETIYAYDTHIHEFYADKTDNYLLRIYSRYQNLEYTIKCKCFHPASEPPMYEVSGSLPKQGVDYWWISNVTKGDLVLLAIQAETSSRWESQLGYCNLTLKEAVYAYDTHIYQLYADETGNLMLKLDSPSQSFEYTIKCSHSVTIVGDIDGDYKVDHKDLLLLASAYGSKVGDPRYIPEADIVCDGRVDFKDLLMLAANYGMQAT